MATEKGIDGKLWDIVARTGLLYKLSLTTALSNSENIGDPLSTANWHN